jgi:hypothetical protein
MTGGFARLDRSQSVDGIGIASNWDLTRPQARQAERFARHQKRPRPRQTRGGSSGNHRRIIARCRTIVASPRWGEHLDWRIFSTQRLKIGQSCR